jgi:anti-sigma regulatory factor (Ser/Thr protein kinase)
MIQPDRTRAELLAEIDAPNPVPDPVSDITDRRVANMDVRVRLCGHSREDLFPLLEIVLSDRFAAVSRAQLLPDLLIPLRNALGNAWKHGNGGDPAKTIAVEMVLTGKGALISITDEGSGFDVALTFQRYKQQLAYFANHGCGFRNLDQAGSRVSYEDGGRTILLCYRPAADTGGVSSSCSAQARPAVDVDSRTIQSCLSELSELGRLVSCRVYFDRGSAADPRSACVPAVQGGAGDECEYRCVLRVADDEGGVAADTRVLTGRLHATEAVARADFEAATQLYAAGISRRVRIPRPVARPTREPRLVLYDFDAWMTLREYLTCRHSLRSVRHAAERIGHLLAALHRSQIAVRGFDPSRAGDGFEALIACVETTLHTLPSGLDLVNRLRRRVERHEERVRCSSHAAGAPIHGALTLDSICYGVDGNFYLYRFENCRWGDHACDVGGFAADLLCFTLAHHDGEAYRTCRDDFVRSYNLESVHRLSADDFHFYGLLALCERLQFANRHSRKEDLVAILNAASHWQLERV